MALAASSRIRIGAAVETGSAAVGGTHTHQTRRACLGPDLADASMLMDPLAYNQEGTRLQAEEHLKVSEHIDAEHFRVCAATH